MKPEDKELIALRKKAAAEKMKSNFVKFPIHKAVFDQDLAKMKLLLRGKSTKEVLKIFNQQDRFRNIPINYARLHDNQELITEIKKILEAKKPLDQLLSDLKSTEETAKAGAGGAIATLPIKLEKEFTDMILDDSPGYGYRVINFLSENPDYSLELSNLLTKEGIFEIIKKSFAKDFRTFLTILPKERLEKTALYIANTSPIDEDCYYTLLRIIEFGINRETVSNIGAILLEKYKKVKNLGQLPEELLMESTIRLIILCGYDVAGAKELRVDAFSNPDKVSTKLILETICQKDSVAAFTLHFGLGIKTAELGLIIAGSLEGKVKCETALSAILKHNKDFRKKLHPIPLAKLLIETGMIISAQGLIEGIESESIGKPKAEVRKLKIKLQSLKEELSEIETESVADTVEYYVSSDDERYSPLPEEGKSYEDTTGITCNPIAGSVSSGPKIKLG